MKKFAVLLTMMLIPVTVFAGAAESVKAVGEGIQLGGTASSTPLGAPVAALGALLSIGADLFSSAGIPTQDQMLINAASKWDKPRTIVESSGVITLKQASSTDAKTTEQIDATIKRVKEEATSGKFAAGNKGIYISTMLQFDRGEWITIGYPIHGEPDKALLLWCNKAADNCILSSASEHVDLPTFNENSKALKSALNGSVATLGEFDAYEPKLSKLSCGVLGSVRPFFGGSPTFANAVKNKLMRRIVDASGYSANNSNTISAKLTKLDISIFHPEWNFELELKSSNGKLMTVKEQYKFDFVFWTNDDKCAQLAKAFGPAVEYLADEIVKKPEFVQLFTK